jgi:hypothetical protein
LQQNYDDGQQNRAHYKQIRSWRKITKLSARSGGLTKHLAVQAEFDLRANAEADTDQHFFMRYRRTNESAFEPSKTGIPQMKQQTAKLLSHLLHCNDLCVAWLRRELHLIKHPI